MSRLIKVFSILLIILFLSLYFSRYYVDYNTNKRIMTEEAIDRFEMDLKSGKTINPADYIVKEKNYNNRASTIGLKVSKFIEKTFKEGFRFIFKYLNDTV